MPDGVDAPDGEAADRPAGSARPRRGSAGGTTIPGRRARHGSGGQRAGHPGGERLTRGRPGLLHHRDEDFFCSGGTINNPQANMVSTAGHCVHPGDGGSVWHDNWVYAPEFTDGVALHGLWSAKEFTSVEGWVDWGYLWWDFAFVTMHPSTATGSCTSPAGRVSASTSPSRTR
ncbi:hypothetical protein NKG94_08040 [Micromonospora sp. M12]